MPATNKGCFRGDADHLVDALVAACETATVRPPHAGFGRELVAWSPDGAAPSPLGALLDGALEEGHYHRGQRHYGSPAAQHYGNRARRASSPRRESSPRRPAGGAYACPSFAAAPKPEALPMPTSSLLTRALHRRAPAAVAVMA